MRIYIAHSKKINYKEDLYKPIREDSFFQNHEIILPHEERIASNNTREFYQSLDLMIAECSDSGTGLGIELGWAYDDKTPLYCIHKENTKINSSIKKITDNIYEYKDIPEMISIIKDIIAKESNKETIKTYIKKDSRD